MNLDKSRDHRVRQIDSPTVVLSDAQQSRQNGGKDLMGKCIFATSAGYGGKRKRAWIILGATINYRVSDGYETPVLEAQRDLKCIVHNGRSMLALVGEAY